MSPDNPFWTLTDEEAALIDATSEPRERWLAHPTDLHYRGELTELGVRVVDAIEMEVILSGRTHNADR